jgi:hypothetical protein
LKTTYRAQQFTDRASPDCYEKHYKWFDLIDNDTGCGASLLHLAVDYAKRQEKTPEEILT